MSSIIRSVAFCNFYNYYGDYKQNQYDLSEGLNIINADNGMGKSKFFNAFTWLLKDQIYDSESHRFVSPDSAPLDMLSGKARLEKEENIKCGVKVVFENRKSRYTVEKFIIFSKKDIQVSNKDINNWNISAPETSVSELCLDTNNSAEIYDIDLKNDIIKNHLIHPAMLNYALLQGEAIDNIVDLSNSEKLAQTVETLTDISELKQIITSCDYFVTQSYKDLQNEQHASSKNKETFNFYKKEYETIVKHISSIKEQIEIYKKQQSLAAEEVEKLKAQLSNTQERVKYGQKISHVEKQIKDKQNQLDLLVSGINNNLFIKTLPWLLLGFNDEINKFSELRDTYRNEQNIKKIQNNPQDLFKSLLPEGSPDNLSLNKMLKQCKCFVCGRTFENQDESYQHILGLLNRSQHTDSRKDEDMHMFFDGILRNVAQYSNVDDNVRASIAKTLIDQKNLKKEITMLKGQLKDLIDAFSNYGGHYGEKDDGDVNYLSRYEKARRDVEEAERKKLEGEKTLRNLEEQEKNIEDKLKNLGGKDVPAKFSDLHSLLCDVKSIFTNTNQRIYDKVLNDLERNSNRFYGLLTQGNNILGGVMKFEKSSYDSIRIKVLDQNGEELTGASEGFQRMKKIAVVMAIIASNVGENTFNYPFIADAPFSSFGKNFMRNFFQTVPVVFNQSIILTKDFYDVDASNLISEDGMQIMLDMKHEKAKGSFYVNYVDDKVDSSNLETIIKCYYKG